MAKQQRIDIQTLSTLARACTLCADKLPLGPKPIIQTHAQSKILIVSQAPGSIAHHSGIPFMDKSGERLRNWMGISERDFYDSKNVAIVPMGFCYPGKAKSGDVPPPKECAQTWQDVFERNLSQVKLRLLIGLHSQRWHLGNNNKKTLTDTVQSWQEYISHWQADENTKQTSTVPTFPLPHPSPRNNIWLAKNPWFERDVVNALREAVRNVLQ